MDDVSNWELVERSTGTKAGVWLVHPDSRRRALVKTPKFRAAGNFFEGELVGEYFSAQVGQVLGLPVPEVDIVCYKGIACPLVWDFRPRRFALIEGCDLTNTRGEKSPLSFQEVLDAICLGVSVDEASRHLVWMICFDVLIGNTDRHQSNWGIVTREAARHTGESS